MKLSSLVERLNTTGEALAITKNGRPAAVMVTPDEYAGWQETVEILQDQVLMQQIQRSLEAVASGEVEEYTLEDFASL